MAKKKTKTQPKKKQVNAENVIGLHSEVTDQPITQTLEVNYMPYAMSVNVSRAFPEIDGFKPSHRKLLYTMYKMGLLKGERQKSANIVGQTMKLNPHGDAAIYETMVRLATGNEALLAPFVESKGNFGKYYSGDLSYAASRYTEAKLSPISAEIFKDIDKDPVDFVDSYDGAMKEPRLLPKCPIGKFRGQPWSEVEAGFLGWMLRQESMEEDLKWNARREIARRSEGAKS